ncbi:hypothetical protein HMPREF1211_06139 [Streptomyces sp. HGB0020]|nr:hypothetical protein HMPREF1211_06139 [Streptomyces sp. HGB0020]
MRRYLGLLRPNDGIAVDARTHHPPHRPAAQHTTLPREKLAGALGVRIAKGVMALDGRFHRGLLNGTHLSALSSLKNCPASTAYHRRKRA